MEGGRHVVKGNNLEINKLDVTDDGIYTCSITELNESASIEVIGKLDILFISCKCTSINSAVTMKITYINTIFATKSEFS